MNHPVDLYFHSPCFDGAVSAVIACAYLESSKQRQVGSLRGVNYHLKNVWLKTDNVDDCYAESLPVTNRSFAVVDFLYHPAAILWADHHPTTFLSQEAKDNYQSCQTNSECLYDSSAPSCAGLMWRKWSPRLRDVPAHFEELVQWADKIDSARYGSIEEAISLPSAALRINLALGTAKEADFSQRLVRLFRAMPLEAVAAQPEVCQEYEKGRILQQQGLERLRNAVHLNDQSIVVFDVDGDGVLVNRYAPFHFFPDARYSAGVVRSRDKCGQSRCKITAMRNPWIEFQSALLGQMCAVLGGGGHRRVGSIILRDQDP